MSSADRIQRQRERAQHLIALRESPSYPVLKEIVERDIRKEFDKFIKTPAVTDQCLDYARGLMFGMQRVLSIIEKGEQQLEIAVKAARQLEEGVT